jgi:lipopolysaccharide biosynthesis glycosyltransferase
MNQQANLEHSVTAMHVSFCADLPYVPILCVALTSLYMHNFQRPIDVTVVLQTVDETAERLIRESAARFNRTVEIIDLKNIDLSHLPEYSQPVSTYYRLLLPSLLKNRNRTIYLDSDLVVEIDLSELFDADLNGHPLGGVPDRDAIQQGLQAHINRPGDLYINAGVLVMDLDKWRKENIAQQCMQWLIENPTIATMMDQDALNYTLYKQKVFFDKKFNLNPIHDPPAKTLTEIPKRVLHFAGAIKPWHSWYDFELIEIFNFYKRAAKMDENIESKQPSKLGQFLSIGNQNFRKGHHKQSYEAYHAVAQDLLQRKLLSDEKVRDINATIEAYRQDVYYAAVTGLRGIFSDIGLPVETQDIYQIPEIR